MSWSKKIALVLLVAFLALQLVPVDRANPLVTGEVDAPPEVLAILERACYDCHSNRVRWPWYGYVAPISLFMQHDVEEGREHVNFSEWDKLSPVKRAKAIEEVWEEVEEGEMPLWFYLPMHPEAKLTATDLAALKTWAAPFAGKSKAGKEAGDDGNERARNL